MYLGGYHEVVSGIFKFKILGGALVGLEIFVHVFTGVTTKNVVMMGNICLSYDHKKWGMVTFKICSYRLKL